MPWAACVLCLLLLAPLAGLGAPRWATAQQNLDANGDGAVNCDDFPSQRAAQRALDRDPSDPHGLDGQPGPAFAGEQGVACEDFDYGSSGGGGSADGGRANRGRGGRQARRSAEPTPEPAPPPARRQNRDRGATPGGAEGAAPAPAPAPVPVNRVVVTAAGPPDVDCADFTYQEQAQAVLARDPSDPFNLDPSGDGWACTSLPSRGGVGGAGIVALPSTGTGPTRPRPPQWVSASTH